jgi:HSP20 family protein
MEVRLVNGLAGSGWTFNRMNDLFRESDRRTRQMVPSVDVIEDKEAYHFYFEMPGLRNESLDARVEGGRLIVSAERKWPEWPQDTEVHVSERGYGTLRRSFELPDDASQDKIAASYKDGVLEVTVEKKAESKPTKILIN